MDRLRVPSADEGVVVAGFEVVDLGRFEDLPEILVAPDQEALGPIGEVYILRVGCRLEGVSCTFTR